jgi:hypothetical protein
MESFASTELNKFVFKKVQEPVALRVGIQLLVIEEPIYWEHMDITGRLRDETM